jgi:fatty acid synthase
MDQKLNFLSAGGLEIQGLQFAIVDNHLRRYKLSNDTLNIVPNIDKSILSLDNILRVILQLVIENTFSEKIQTVNLINDSDSKNIKSLKTIMQDIPEASLFTINEITYEKATFKKALTIINNLKNYNIHEISNKLGINKFLLVFIPTDQEYTFSKLTIAAGLKIIILRKFTNELIILLRKKRIISNIHVLNISKNIHQTINTIKSTNILSNNERIVVIIKTKNKFNLNEFINEIEVLNLEKIRFFIIEDSTISSNLFNSKFYGSQLELDLFINILCPNKVWATLRRIKINVNPRLCKHWIANQFNSYYSKDVTWKEGSRFESIENIIKVEYSILNLQEILLTDECFYIYSSEMIGTNQSIKKCFGLEFSGVDSKGNRVMGVTNGNSMSNFVKMDKDLTWMIPNSWSFEDATTVPLAYLIAYSSLFEKAQIQSGESIILSDSTYGFGLAIIFLAVHNKCDIYVTYKSNIEKDLIQSMFPNIHDNRLFNISNNHFIDNILMETKGKGVDVIICNQHEIRTPKIFFTLAKLQARVILISDFNDNKIHENIGMESFLKEIIFYSLVPKKLLVSNTERKKALASMIQNGINNGFVKPLPRIVYHRDTLNEAINTYIDNNHFKKVSF